MNFESVMNKIPWWTLTALGLWNLILKVRALVTIDFDHSVFAIVVGGAMALIPPIVIMAFGELWRRRRVQLNERS